MKISKRASAEELLDSKYLAKNVDIDLLKSDSDITSPTLMETIKPSANMNLLKNRLPEPKYQSFLAAKKENSKENSKKRFYMTPRLDNGKGSSLGDKKPPSKRLNSANPKKRGVQKSPDASKFAQKGQKGKEGKKGRARYLSPGGIGYKNV